MHIIPSLVSAGGQKFVVDLSNEMSKEHEVVIVTLYKITDDMFMADLLNKNIRLISFDKKVGFDISMFNKIYRSVKRERPDIINTHLRVLIYSVFAILFTNIRFFHTVHNMADKETGKSNRSIYKILFRYFSVVPIGISHRVLNSIKNVYGDQFDVMVDNGVEIPKITAKYEDVRKEIESYKKDEDTKVFLNIGRIGEQKNQRMLVEVFNGLIEEDHNVILMIIGEDVSEDNSLKQDLIDLSKDEIHFLGLKDNIADYLQCSDAFCLSSLYEGLPITLLEALALGITPICTPAGGIVDVLTPEIGFVSKGFDHEEYLSEVLKFMDLSPEAQTRMSNSAKNTFNNKYSIESTAKEYLSLYKIAL